MPYATREDAYRILKDQGALSYEELSRELKKVNPGSDNFTGHFPILSRREDVGTLKLYYRPKYFPQEGGCGKANQLSFLYILGEEEKLGEAAYRAMPEVLTKRAKIYFTHFFKKNLPEKAYETFRQKMKER